MTSKVSVSKNTSLRLSTSLPTYVTQPKNNFSLEVELDKRIGKAATFLSKLNKKVLENRQLTAKVVVYKACVISTLLYCSESCTSYAA